MAPESTDPQPQEEPPVAETPEEPSPAPEGEAQEPSEGESFGLEPAPEEKAKKAEATPPPLAMTPTNVKMTSTQAQMPTKQTANGPVAVLPETGGPGAGLLPWLLTAVLGGAAAVLLGLLHRNRRGSLTRTSIPAAPRGRREG